MHSELTNCPLTNVEVHVTLPLVAVQVVTPVVESVVQLAVGLAGAPPAKPSERPAAASETTRKRFMAFPLSVELLFGAKVPYWVKRETSQTPPSIHQRLEAHSTVVESPPNESRRGTWGATRPTKSAASEAGRKAAF